MISEAARRYARAFYELAKESKKQEVVFSELRVISKAIDSDKTIGEFISSPLVTPEQKLSIIKATLNGKTSPEVFNGLLLLAQKNRLTILTEIVNAFENISDQENGVTRGTVTSASALGAEARKQIEDTVSGVTKKKVILNFSEDKSLMGGMIAEVGGWTFDDSLETHLTRMSEELNRRTH